MPEHDPTAAIPGLVIDGLQYCNWSPEIFDELRQGGVSAVHVTVCYWEIFCETRANIERWNRWIERYPDRLTIVRDAGDVRTARDQGKTGTRVRPGSSSAFRIARRSRTT